MSAYLQVRARVHAPARRDEFDRWYESRHLPDARKAFGADAAWRGWSATDPLVHFAFYEFADAAAARAILDSDALQALVAEFDATWGGDVTREREIIERTQTI